MSPAAALLRQCWWHLIDAVDDWAHEHGLMKPIEPLRWLCNYRERRIIGAEECRRHGHLKLVPPTHSVYFDFANGFVTTSSNTTPLDDVTWTRRTS